MFIQQILIISHFSLFWGNISEQNNDDLLLCSAYILVGGEAITRHCILKIVIAIKKEQVEQGQGKMD